MRIWEGCGGKCLRRVCADVSLRELWPALLIEAVLGCLAGSDDPICGASATVPFEVHPDCGLMRESRLDSQKSMLLDHSGCRCACIAWLASC